jgi:hypothetical protein
LRRPLKEKKIWIPRSAFPASLKTTIEKKLGRLGVTIMEKKW